MPKTSRPKKQSDKKLNRFSTILEIISNLGNIASWILGTGSAYILNVQKFPVIVPGIGFTLDSNFQFALVISGILAYIHFLQSFWKQKNLTNNYSDSFTDFIFWDLPRFKSPLLLIPIAIIISVTIQIVSTSVVLSTISIIIFGLIIFGIISRFRYHLSSMRRFEKLADQWDNDDAWKERWEKRITARLNKFGYVKVSDFQESGLSITNKRDKVEIVLAFQSYFLRFEFSQDLIMQRTDTFPYRHPLHSVTSSAEWASVKKEYFVNESNYD